MENKENEQLGDEHVPPQVKGSEMNAVEETVLATEQEAIAYFEMVKQRLMDVNHWGEISKLPMSTFRLTNSEGEEIEGLAKEGAFIRIDIPGPGTHAGEGFDWVVIESIRSERTGNSEYLSIRVRPALKPSGNGKDTAHFLKNDATSTFQVKRIGNTITAEEHGRNEVPNTTTERILDNMRNAMVGWSAKLGMSYPQWKSLVAGLLDINK